MVHIADNIITLTRKLPSGLKVVAVTKTRSPEEVLEAYNAGFRIFGENRVQELASKKAVLPDDIKWHLIGHLQSNKARLAVASASMIESVDTIRLLGIINTEAAKQQKIMDCLLQVHISSEETKYGFSISETEETDWRAVAAAMPYIRICGFMGMATFTENMEQVRSEFKSLSLLFQKTQKRSFYDCGHFTVISMGMSADWHIAVEEGSTMIRVGTLIFGERKKK